MVTLSRQFEHHDPTAAGQHEQLQMFMSPREILHKYQPLDADRMDYEYDAQPSSGTGIGTAMNTGESNVAHGKYRFGSDSKGAWQATTYGTKYREGGMESDEDLWNRKLDEAQYEHTVPGKETVWSGATYHPSSGSRSSWESSWRVSQPGTPERSLYEAVAEEGAKEPVSLGTSGGYGSMGKREIVGGHHRIASQFDINPDQPMPVLHFQDIYDARAARYKPYT